MEEKDKIQELDALNTKPSNVNIYFIRQGEPQGSGHAIKLAKTFVGDDHFAVLYGDDIMKSKSNIPALKQLINIHEKTNSNVIGCLEVAKELSIHYNSLDRWISEYEEYGESAFPGHGSALYSYQYEIKKLKAENLELRKELELLKKFQAFLKKKNT